MHKKAIFPKVKEFVLARIKAIFSKMEFLIGENYFSKNELMPHVKNEDEIGEQIMKTQLESLTS